MLLKDYFVYEKRRAAGRHSNIREFVELRCPRPEASGFWELV